MTKETVSLLKANSYQDKLPEKLAKLLEPLGGLTAFCKRGDSCLLKPNFVMARSVESGATTHPALIMALVTLLSDLGCLGIARAWGTPPESSAN